MAITTATSQQTTNATTSAVTLPASVASGDMLLALLCEDSGAASNTWTAGWTELLDSAVQSVIVAAAAYKIAAGGETSVTATHTTERSNHIAVRIPAAEWANDGTAPVISTIATNAGSNAPNPTGVTFPWSATHNTIFIAVAFWDDSTTVTCTARPTGYTDNQVSNVTATSAGDIAIAVKPSSAASSPEDPGAFTLSGSEQWGAIVIAVKGLAGHFASPTITGGGVLTAAKTTARAVSPVDTGGGVLAVTKTTARTRSNSGTGGGVLTASLRTARAVSTTMTGGGVLTRTSLKSGQVSAATTGGGVLNLSSLKSAQVAATETGGGVLNLSTSGGHSGSATATGGGVAQAGVTTLRSASASATGGGILTVIGLGSRSGSQALTGGGAATVRLTTVRGVSASATGGGVASPDGVNGSGPPEVSVHGTGGGVASVSTTTARRVSVLGPSQQGTNPPVPIGTGGGSAVLGGEAVRETSVSATGSGSATLTWQGVHEGELGATGGGTVDIDGGLPGTSLEGIVVTVGFAQAPTASVGTDGRADGVRLEPEATAEVTIS